MSFLLKVSGISDKAYTNPGENNKDSYPLMNPYINIVPFKPAKSSGPVYGMAGVKYEYTSITTDYDGDQIWYMWNWGDETGVWLGPYTSGAVCEASHTWEEQGDYNIKAKAKDQHGDDSRWSDPLSISMPKSKPYINTPFLNFLQNVLQNHPLIYQLLQRLLKL